MSSKKCVPEFETELKEIQDSYAELHPESELNSIRDKFKQQVEKIRIMPKFKRVGNLNVGEIMEVVEEAEVNLEDLKTKSYWNTERQIQAVEISPDGKSVICRKDGWNTILFNEIFTIGVTTIEFMIVKDGSGNKMYIGALAANSENLSLHKALSSTSGQDIWAYRICGELHTNGFAISVHKEKRRFKRGDIIKMSIDMEQQAITYYRNDTEIHTFTDIAGEILPFVNFGESFQTVKVTRMDSTVPSVIYH